jgi:hypothetical protein
MEILFGFLVLATLMILAVTVYPRLWGALDAWRETRGKRVIVCPETGTCEAVAIDRRTAVTTSLAGSERLKLSACTRWPERAGCGEECLAQIEAAPDGCMVRQRLGTWYAGKSCALCGQAFGEIHWADHKPGLLAPDGQPVGWHDLPAEKVPATLETHRPLCWNCYVAEDFRAMHRDLVLEDPWHPAPRRDSQRRAS